MPGTVQDEATLDGYFNNTNKPDQTKFWDLIRSMFAGDKASKDVADAASASATTALAAAPKVILRAQWNGSSAWVKQTNLNNAVSAVGMTGPSGGFYTITITFAAAFASANYAFHFSQISTPGAYVSAVTTNTLTIITTTLNPFALTIFMPS